MSYKPICGLPYAVGSLPDGRERIVCTAGAMLSGYARFTSGAKAHWFLDEMGRLGLDPELGSGKPTQADMQEFSTELRRMLQQTGGM